MVCSSLTSEKVAQNVCRAYPALYKIIRNEGMGGLYKGRRHLLAFKCPSDILDSGFAPKVLRLAPGGGVLLLVVEALSTGEPQTMFTFRNPN